MRLKFLGALLVSSVVAWLLSGYILSHLNPVYLYMQVKSQPPQVLSLVSSKDEQFHRISRKSVLVDKLNDWQTVRLPITVHRATHLRLEFRYPETTTYFRDIQLNGQPLDLLQAYQYQTRDIIWCNQLQSGEISCLSADNRGYITFPPQQLASVIPAVPWWKQILCFAICFLCCLLVYKRYSTPIFSLLQKQYPTWIIAALFLLLVYAYYAMRTQAFLPRLHAVFFTVSWRDLLFLFQEQAWAPALLLACACAAFVLKQKHLKVCVLFLGFVLLLLESTDCAILHLFNARFSPEQISIFGPDFFTTAGPFIKSYFTSTAGIYNILLIVIWFWLSIFAWRYSLPVNLKKVISVFAVMGFIWYLVPSALTPAEKLQLRDWPRLSLPRVLPSKINGQAVSDFDLTYKCQNGLNSQQNIIIILVESLSSYMSDYFSGGKAENWTPQLDKLARQYVSFTDFRATNPDTTQALFSIFTGFPAIHYYAEGNLYREPKFYRRTLPKAFHQAGYHTAFFTSASFAFSKDHILERVGFDEISTDTDPFYNGKKRFAFHSVADDVLYARAQQWVADYKQSNPYLLVLETTTSHSPYIHPASGQESLEKTIRYVDKALGDFIENLSNKKLLDNTLVVITSDHRAMLPVNNQETRIFGSKAESSIPFVLIGSPLKGKQIAPSTHIDLWPSLEYLALPQACFHPYQANIFASGTVRNSCTLFQSFFEKDAVLLQCQDQFAQLCLTKDNDFICKGELPQDTTENLLSFTNWIRDNNRY